MLKSMFALLAAVMIGSLIGCENGKAKTAEVNPSVLDVKPVRHAAKPAVASGVAADPAPSDAIVYAKPVSATPTYATAASITPTTLTPATPAAKPAAGNQYQVKSGDTLYAIARNTYGDGKHWTRIASANPGLSPTSLKAGQTITLP
ncbi:MAG TPA: LysM peptidoglycan-binding domain-containing protein [Tepidisphaeraceae bacterium]|jgi:5'-nucleotidase|nr:LysM peptidoglycan-binding domain-containing protein [Tepidisphaeraceae bacterium]